MPHLIIEYSVDCIDEQQAVTMVDAVFDTAKASGLFETRNIKSRAIPISAYRLGVEGRGFVCVRCRIHAGRSSEQKKQLSGEVVRALRELELGVAAITAEVVDMDPASYTRYYVD
ncbi:5-carboxymethyl-2-hydroxymuconate Delta-isomerase [Thiohalophilus thiocyanatoxydans]|uniref:5-carboxymethyl-2-hydroxymuconate isomerase n=1 Tax=Thiohalophilus thiocyanatoxydans TaxID=381308 RepID=A0A4R8J1G6_9GAMM|nr:5-carboxymethyl-2-hydroxymuconate Delta-isomerase [Thiohalophilus thiocyanatoxydans]TDY04019.1 5-carboxymethyl-2-hydroxymuconate isomerase [Thiohalophilus thiocyanatoxydans]